MNKYINEMEDYLYNHNYISENNNNVKQQELSVERASCIVQKYRTLTEEKDKEIDKLNEELGDANYTITQLHKVMDKHYVKKEDYDRLNNIIEELEKEFEWQLKKQIDIDKFAEKQGFLNYNPVKLMVEHFKNKLKNLKEGK